MFVLHIDSTLTSNTTDEFTTGQKEIILPWNIDYSGKCLFHAIHIWIVICPEATYTEELAAMFRSQSETADSTVLLCTAG